MDIIDDVLTSFTTRIHSHRSSWARMQKQMLFDSITNVELTGGDLEKIKRAEKWFVSHGMEFNGVYNLNSGWLPEHAARLRAMIDKGYENVFSLEREMPNLTEVLRSRASKSEHNLREYEWRELSDLCRNVEVIKHDEMVGNKRVVLGDSHSVARFRSGTKVLRHDGLTLRRLLHNGVGNMLTADHAEHLVIQAGNIDIRHHLLRQPDAARNSVESLMADLWSQLHALQSEGRILTFEVTAAYPIEFEGRKLPKTGYYKGTPFCGSREDRVAISRFMHHEMLIRFPVVKWWPQRWYDMDPEEYAEQFMEKPRSVHLSPEFHEWNYEKGTANVS